MLAVHPVAERALSPQLCNEKSQLTLPGHVFKNHSMQGIMEHPALTLHQDGNKRE